MKIRITQKFMNLLDNHVDYIASDKPKAARKFKKDLIRNIKTDLTNPFHYQKSKYYKDEVYRDYVFKGYTIVYKIEVDLNFVSVFGLIKYK